MWKIVSAREEGQLGGCKKVGGKEGEEREKPKTYLRVDVVLGDPVRGRGFDLELELAEAFDCRTGNG